MQNIIKKHRSLILAFLTLWITIIILLISSVSQNQGNLVYALDDPYIHMS